MMKVIKKKRKKNVVNFSFLFFILKYFIIIFNIINIYNNFET